MPRPLVPLAGPELEGSAKQVAWATTVRADKVREFDVDCRQMPEAERNHYRQVMLRELRAEVWIEHQYRPWQMMLTVGFDEAEWDKFTAKNSGPESVV